MLHLSNELNSILVTFETLIKKVQSHRDLNDLKIHFLGRNGLVTLQAKLIGDISSKEEKKNFGTQVNKLMQHVQSEILNAGSRISGTPVMGKNETIDITLPGRDEYQRGTIHPISHVIEEVEDICYSMGLQQVSGPNIETEWYNFTALNMDKYHPARKMHDTFYIKDLNSNPSSKKNNNLLRTHTSTIQIRHMLNNKPPIKAFSVGKVYRADHDCTHTPMFHQLECLVIDKKSNLKTLYSCINTFLHLLFNTNITLSTRFRSSYFPFTEPSFEVDLKQEQYKKEKDNNQKNSGWLEILGCGMVSPIVLSKVNISHEEYQGFAFGMGIERIAMLKYGIKDIRKFFEGDIRWLKHYGF